jgi:hypothetical protein
LSWLGIPVAILISGELVTGTAGYSLRPSLQIHRVVGEKSLGFNIMLRLEWDDLDAEAAKDLFQQLYRSDSTFKTHINPQGRTYLQELVHYGPWGQYGHRSEEQLEMLKFFVQELGITAGMDNAEFVSSGRQIPTCTMNSCN